MTKPSFNKQKSPINSAMGVDTWPPSSSCENCSLNFKSSLLKNRLFVVSPYLDHRFSVSFGFVHFQLWFSGYFGLWKLGQEAQLPKYPEKGFFLIMSNSTRVRKTQKSQHRKFEPFIYVAPECHGTWVWCWSAFMPPKLAWVVFPIHLFSIILGT